MRAAKLPWARRACAGWAGAVVVLASPSGLAATDPAEAEDVTSAEADDPANDVDEPPTDEPVEEEVDFDAFFDTSDDGGGVTDESAGDVETGGFFSDAPSVIDDSPISVAGSLKTFTIGSYPYEHLLLPDDPTVSAALVGRLILRFEALDDMIAAEVHPLVVGTTGGLGGGAGGITSLGVGQARPEAIDLSLDPIGGASGTVNALIDRAFVRLRVPHFDLTIGRQPISFGTGFFFTPMDLVAPFSPATIDREFKPGVDAIRGDLYLGTATRFTALVTYAGAWDLDGIVAAAHARTTVVGVDLGAFLARAYGDQVFGIEMAGDALGVGLRAEATATFPAKADAFDFDDGELTLPQGGPSPFLRAVVGADVRFDTLSFFGELYVQTLGELDPEQYLTRFADERFGRGELWLAGRYYGALSGSWQVNPLLTTSVSGFVNFGDASIMVSPALSWSVSDEVDLNIGAQLSQGSRPKEVTEGELLRPDGTPKSPAEVQALFVPQSEFGLYPYVAFAQLRVAF